MHRLSKVTLVAVGTILSLLIGAGVFALTSDSITSAGNSAESGTYATPTHNLQAASSDSFSFDCATATYGDTLGTSFAATDLDPGQSSGQYYRAKIFCLKNVGTAPARLTASVVNFVQTDTGCSAGEFEAGDSNCGGGAGEFGSVAKEFFSGYSQEGADADCIAPGSASTFIAGYSDAELNSSLPAGGFCRFVYYLYPTFAEVTEEQKLQAQTDRIQWDLVFSVSDVAA